MISMQMREKKQNSQNQEAWSKWNVYIWDRSVNTKHSLRIECKSKSSRHWVMYIYGQLVIFFLFTLLAVISNQNCSSTVLTVSFHFVCITRNCMTMIVVIPTLVAMSNFEIMMATFLYINNSVLSGSIPKISRTHGTKEIPVDIYTSMELPTSKSKYHRYYYYWWNVQFSMMNSHHQLWLSIKWIEID